MENKLMREEVLRRPIEKWGLIELDIEALSTQPTKPGDRKLRIKLKG